MLYPITKSIATYEIETDGHLLHIEEVGNRRGMPILFLHGGPGSGCSETNRKLFDPEKFRIIFPDQRGSGQSLPSRSLKNNSTGHLVNDIELIRNKLNIRKWIVVGGSWGSTLALTYAQSYPKNIIAIVLRSLFLGSDKEVEWAFKKAAKIFKPELYEEFCNLLPPGERKDPIAALGRRLEKKDPSIFIPAARLWGAYEESLSSINEYDNRKFPSSLYNKDLNNKNYYPKTPFLEWHYIKNKFFLKDNELLNGIHKISHIPGKILQSRYDLLCPPISSYLVSEKWNNSSIEIIPSAGHYITETGVQEKMIEVIEDLSKLF